MLDLSKLHPDDVERFLRDNADDAAETTYSRPFTEDEMAEMKQSLADVSIKLNDLEEEKKEFMDSFKAKTQPFESEKKALLRDLKTKAKLVSGTCYKFVDHEERRVYFYSPEGHVIESRAPYASEMQLNMFSLNIRKNGTNN